MGLIPCEFVAVKSKNMRERSSTGQGDEMWCVQGWQGGPSPVVHSLGDATRGCGKQAKGKAVLLLEDSLRQCGMAGERASFSVSFVVLPVT